MPVREGARGLLIGGTTSDAGKSLLTAGVCRWLRRMGIDVAPFKAQNMSNNSMVCPDGTEIGRAQWVQALACGLVPSAELNPVLLKPGTDRRSHVILSGRPAGELRAREWATGRKELAREAFAAFERLAAKHEVVVAEGAGSIAEVNLREGDYTNLGLARAVGLPVVVVGDIDRGGVLAAMYGSWALLDDADRGHLKGWIVNKFRGDVDLLRPGLEVVESRTGLPVFGVMPYLRDVWLDGEDALTLGAWQARGAGAASATEGEASGPGEGASALRVAVVAFPRLSNATDIDALAAEPGVPVDLVDRPEHLAGADLIVLPGSRATLSDLGWLRERGLAEAVTAAAGRGVPVLGVCGGYQMLAERIVDKAAVESRTPTQAPGLGLLPIEVVFEADKHTRVVTGEWRGHPVESYEIHHGVVHRSHTEVGNSGSEIVPFLDGWQRDTVFGTTWHGAFENDAFRRAYLTEIANRTGRSWTATSAPGFRAQREQMLERLADAVAEHLDTDALLRLLRL
ncbi:adenosylcobyric acid synthase [Kineosphaera limosa]|uniref:cobyric acid synthase n=1 Tax=Kineosphaera limosa TaxID=111564 RepID=UPI00058E6A9C|nr:cobyric acid synthase [Kineosphaera limosa]NYE03047.1 adenosylcobyric acid synthase [Kineosphaera limosa]